MAKHRKGTYWGIRSHVADYGLADPLPCPPDKTLVLANTKTRLKRLDAVVQARLINWGYAICDTAMRKWVDPSLAKPMEFPYPASGIGEAVTYPSLVHSVRLWNRTRCSTTNSMGRVAIAAGRGLAVIGRRLYRASAGVWDLSSHLAPSPRIPGARQRRQPSQATRRQRPATTVRWTAEPRRERVGGRAAYVFPECGERRGLIQGNLCVHNAQLMASNTQGNVSADFLRCVRINTQVGVSSRQC